MYIIGANLHIESGGGATDATVNGLGNLIVGYNEPNPSSALSRGGSHNIVVGMHHNYYSVGGLVAGYQNTINGPYASIIGGEVNLASGESSSVGGGQYNIASGRTCWVSGAIQNTASGFWSSVGGGYQNIASGDESAVSGGAFWVQTNLGGWAGGSYSTH